MKKTAITLSLALAALGAAAQSYTVVSPDGSTAATVAATADGGLAYSVQRDGHTMLAPSPLGLRTSIGDFGTGLRVVATDTATIRRSYEQTRIKRSHVDYAARSLRLTAVNAAADTLGVELRVADGGDVAFRYLMPRQRGGELGAVTVLGEHSGFALPAGSTAFVTPQSPAMVGWKRTKPSYEEVYAVDVPAGTPSQYGLGFTFPALFRTAAGGWVLLGETGVDSRYVGSRLSDADSAGVYRIAFPMPEENNGNGDTTAARALPAATPWRTITTGLTLAPIVETTVAWDLVEPLYEATEAPRPGKGTWSWILWQDESMNMADQKAYVDLAAALGYDHVLDRKSVV